MKNNERTKKIAAIGVLLAVMVALQLFSNYITFGPVSITLALTPIVIGAILYGPLVGGFLGFVNGIITITAPSTQALFMANLPFWTIVVCLLKMTAAGVVPGFIYKALEKKNSKVGIILGSLSAPVTNTGLFAVFGLTIFVPIVEGFVGTLGSSVAEVLFIGFIGWNFFLEFGINAILASAIVYIVNIYNMKHGKKQVQNA